MIIHPWIDYFTNWQELHNISGVEYLNDYILTSILVATEVRIIYHIAKFCQYKYIQIYKKVRQNNENFCAK